MDKREIIIRLVEYRTGLIYDEQKKKLVCNFWHKKDKNDLHAYLDAFIERVRSSSPDDTFCLEFIFDMPFREAKLPF